MGLVKTGVSAVGKLLTVVALAGAFLVGLIGVVYLSLRGEEVKIPEVVGKDFKESEKELETIGLRIKKVSERYSQEKPGTILEQRPRPGEAGKTGLMISVVVAEASSDGKEAPATIQKDTKEEEAETTAELEIPSDKAKKTAKNANVKKAATTRDVISSKTNKNSNSNTAANTTDTGEKNDSGTKSNTSTGNTKPVQPTPKPSVKPSTVPLQTPKPTPTKSPVSGGDLRSRRAPQDN